MQSGTDKSNLQTWILDHILATIGRRMHSPYNVYFIKENIKYFLDGRYMILYKTEEAVFCSSSCVCMCVLVACSG